jgi:type IV pilus assembly protein PilX
MQSWRTEAVFRLGPRIRRCEQGAALLTALILMLAVLMTGIAATRSALQGARAAAIERDRLLALEMANVGLRDAERDIDGGAAPTSARAAAFAAGNPAPFADGCERGRPFVGMCRYDPDALQQASRLAEERSPAVWFGAYTGRELPVGGGGLPDSAPRYLIELLPPAGADRLYRITALGTGARPETEAVVQAYYRKPPAGAPGRRVGWREIGNWAEVRDGMGQVVRGGGR